VDIPTGPPPIHFRGESIIPTITDGDYSNTESTKHKGLTLIVFAGKSKTALGDLFWDDGESINTVENGKYNYYTFDLLSNCTLQIHVIKSGYDAGSSPQNIDWIHIADTVEGDVEAHIDGKVIASPIRKGGGTQLDAKLNLQSKKAGEKWVINWKLTKTNSCNVK